MPMTIMSDEFYGRRCDECGKLATHYYGNTVLCCQCHGGEILSEEETEEWHESYTKEKGLNKKLR